MLKRRNWYVIPMQGEEEPLKVLAFPVIVGRDDDADVTIDDEALGSCRLQLSSSGRNVQVCDLNSVSSTKLDGELVEQAVVTRRSGATITLASFSFQLRYCSAADAQRIYQESQGIAPEQQWYVSHEGREFGPLSRGGLFNAARSGALSRDDAVWTSDPTQRMRADEIEGLFPDEPVGAGDVAEDGAEETSGDDFLDPGGESIVCPHCWHRFETADLLSISRSGNALGDPVLGPDEQLRFLPTQFNALGQALDEDGVACPDVACPRCRMRLPLALTSTRQTFLSIVGAPASGKSVYLAAMSWTMRTTMPSVFGVNFVDADAVTNRWLNRYEELLFKPVDPDKPEILRKTEQQGELYKQARIDGADVMLPLPCAFVMERDPTASAGAAGSRALVLYDNAGENFQPTGDSLGNPGTEHLVVAEGIIFVFDVTKESQFRRLLMQEDVPLSAPESVEPQYPLFVEMVNRIQKYSGVGTGSKCDKPLVVCVSKADVLGTRIDISEGPWDWDTDQGCYALDLARIASVSYATRRLLWAHAPQFVATVEASVSNAVYIPVSALGHCPMPREQAPSASAYIPVLPSAIDPKWVEVPVLYLLSRIGCVPTMNRPAQPSAVVADYEIRGRAVHLTVPGTDEVLDVPLAYSGYSLQAPESGRWFTVPQLPGVPTV